MPDARSRPFDLADALILMAALAVGLGMALMESRLKRSFLTGPWTHSPPPVAGEIEGWGRLDDLIDLWRSGHGEACILAPVTLAAGALCFRRPRPRIRSLVLRIRLVPTLCVAACLAITMPLILKSLMDDLSVSYFFMARFIDEIRAAGAGVLAIGIGLALGRRFRVRGWLDWLGLGLGIYWAWLWAWSVVGRIF